MTPFTCAVVSHKGGVGKTLITANLAAYWASDGQRVLAIDFDPQRSLLDWAGARRSTPPTVAALDANQGMGSVADMQRGYDVTVIDVQGRSSALCIDVMLAADLVVIPLMPAAVDLWATQALLEDLPRVQKLNPRLRAGFVLNGYRKTATAGEVSRVVEEAGLPVLGRLGMRVAFSDAVGAGLGVTEASPSNMAAYELRELAHALEDVVNGRTDAAE